MTVVLNRLATVLTATLLATSSPGELTAQDALAITEIATPITPGQGTIEGDLSDGAQDAWFFNVPENAPLALHTVTFEGLDFTGGVVLLARIELNDQGQVTRRTDITRGGYAPGTGPGRVVLNKTLLEPGTYLFGVAPFLDGDGAYRMNFDIETPQVLTGALTEGLWTVDVGSKPSCIALDRPQPTQLTLYSSVETAASVEITPLGVPGAKDRSLTSPQTRFTGLAAEPMEICLRSRRDGPVVLELETFEIAEEFTDKEPDGDGRIETVWAPNRIFSGYLDDRAGSAENDRIQLPATSDPHELLIELPVGKSARYSLNDADDEPLKSGQVQGLLSIGPLAPGTEYSLMLSSQGETTYAGALLPLPPLLLDEEIEPNDFTPQGPVLQGAGAIHGVLTGEDKDSFRFDTSEGAQLWRLQVTGDDVRQVIIRDSVGETLADLRANGSGRIRIDDLYLLPGPHEIIVSGAGSYRIRSIGLGPRRADREVEPNGTGPTEQLIEVGTELTGMVRPGDTDSYRLSYAGNERLRIALDPPLGNSVMVELQADGARLFRQQVGKDGHPLAVDRQFQPGTYSIRITPSNAEPVLDDYRLSVSVAPDVFGNGDDLEPNDLPADAGLWTMVHPLIGRVGEAGDSDQFRMTPETDRTVIFCDPERALRLTLKQMAPKEGRVSQERVERNGQTCTAFPLEAGGSYLASLSSSGVTPEGVPYRVDVSDQIPAPATSEVALSLLDMPPAPRAFLSGHTQSLPIVLNFAGAAENANLTLRSSDQRVQLNGITPEGPDRIRATLVLPADLTEAPIRVHFKARTEGAFGQTSLVLEPAPEASATGAAAAQPVPPTLRGGLNAAASVFGGTLQTSDGAPLTGSRDGIRKPLSLIDGLAPAQVEFYLETPGPDRAITLDLAGETPLSIVGLLATPRAYPGASQTLRAFSVEASIDGQNFKTVHQGTLTPLPEEQPVVFDTPVMATHMRLVTESAWSFDGRPDRHTRLAELKVIATPGQALPGFENGINIADPAFGGQIVRTVPVQLLGQGWHRELLLPNDRRGDQTPALEAEIVMGFHNGRIASLDRLNWEQLAETSGAALGAETVEIHATQGTPFGPWTELGAFKPQVEGSVEHAFAPGTNARYLRLVLSAPAEASALRLPDRIEIFEPPVTAQTPSILGEWGEFTLLGPKDELRTEAGPAFSGSSKTAPEALPFQTRRESAVHRGTHVDWWTLDPLPIGSEITVDLETTGGGARPVLRAPDGSETTFEPVDAIRSQEAGAKGRLYTARTQAEGAHIIRVFEPRRAIVVTWDTSGSTTPYRQAIARALRDIAAEADPEVELLNFLPFGAPALLPGLSGDPELLLRALGSDSGAGNSSDAEGALRSAMELLSEHDGGRGLILITDAATNRAAGLWEDFERVRPMVAALAIPSSGAFSSNPAAERDLMETWARAGNGHYAYISTQKDFLDNFQRAAMRLRAPKPYAITVSHAQRPLGQGTLVVRSMEPATLDQESQPSRGTLMVLFDTSGSMLKRENGTRRIAIAKAALAEVADSAEEAGLTFGLRRFGILPDQCDSALIIDPASPAPETAGEQIAAIQPQNLAKTPLAMALAQASNDLAAAEPPHRVVVLTDGEETCDGDPGKEIAAMAEAGIATRIDIIGFQINDDLLAQQFEAWARLGNGDYFSASAADELADALSEVASQRFEVLQEGSVIAEGAVGGPPITLIEGTYLLRNSLSGRAQEFVIRPDEQTELDAGTL